MVGVLHIMTVALPFCSADAAEMRRLLDWIERLGGCRGHKALLVVDAGVSWSDVQLMQQATGRCFDAVQTVTTAAPVTGWPIGCNTLFYECASEMEGYGPWIWMEPDAIPTRPGWLDEIAAEYARVGNPFMGSIYEHQGKRYMSGVGVFAGHIPPQDMQTAFDVVHAGLFVPMATNTKLIQHFWGTPGVAPTFRETHEPGEPINTFSIDGQGQCLDPAAAIFHRCKDGSLIEVLRRQLFPRSDHIMVAFPFCSADGHLALKLMQWIVELSPGMPNGVVLSFDDSTPAPYIDGITQLARQAFAEVHQFVYQCPRRHGLHVLPQSWAFFNCAEHMRKFGVPWLWCEADCVPLKPEWLSALEQRYYQAGLPFCGPIVRDMGHANGTAIYPPDALDYMPRAVAQPMEAWDVASKPEMIRYCADLQPLFQHVWGVHDGKVHPYIGAPPVFDTQQKMGWLDPRAVIFHREKSGELIQRLRERRK